MKSDVLGNTELINYCGIMCRTMTPWFPGCVVKRIMHLANVSPLVYEKVNDNKLYSVPADAMLPLVERARRVHGGESVGILMSVGTEIRPYPIDRGRGATGSARDS